VGFQASRKLTFTGYASKTIQTEVPFNPLLLKSDLEILLVSRRTILLVKGRPPRGKGLKISLAGDFRGRHEDVSITHPRI